MTYSRIPDIEMPWTYKELMALPIFMKEEVYKMMNEFIEEKKKQQQALNR